MNTCCEDIFIYWNKNYVIIEQQDSLSSIFWGNVNKSTLNIPLNTKALRNMCADNLLTGDSRVQVSDFLNEIKGLIFDFSKF